MTKVDRKNLGHCGHGRRKRCRGALSMADSSRHSVVVFLRLPVGDVMLSLVMPVKTAHTVDAAVRRG